VNPTNTMRPILHAPPPVQTDPLFMPPEPPPDRPQAMPAADSGRTAGEGKVWRTAELLRWIRDHLDERNVDSPRVCAELLLSSVLGCDRLRLYMEPQRPASAEERATLRALVARAARHEPVQHLVGEGWFLSRPYHVGPEVLIPRPATETLVGEALSWIRARSADAAVSVLDVGTGSGCIAISLALDARPPERRSEVHAARAAARAAELASSRIEGAGDIPLEAVAEVQTFAAPSDEIDHAAPLVPAPEEVEADPAAARSRGLSISLVATDLQASAIETARRNAERHGVSERIEFAVGDLFDPVAGRRFDLICANPPYIDDARWAEVPANVRFEPETALRGGPDGLAVLGRLIESAGDHLEPGGAILLEFQFDQGLRIRERLEASGFESISIIPDHEGHDRIAFAVRP